MGRRDVSLAPSLAVRQQRDTAYKCMEALKTRVQLDACLGCL